MFLFPFLMFWIRLLFLCFLFFFLAFFFFGFRLQFLFGWFFIVLFSYFGSGLFFFFFEIRLMLTNKSAHLIKGPNTPQCKQRGTPQRTDLEERSGKLQQQSAHSTQEKHFLKYQALDSV